MDDDQIIESVRSDMTYILSTGTSDMKARAQAGIALALLMIGRELRVIGEVIEEKRFHA